MNLAATTITTTANIPVPWPPSRSFFVIVRRVCIECSYSFTRGTREKQSYVSAFMQSYDKIVLLQLIDLDDFLSPIHFDPHPKLHLMNENVQI